MTSVFIFRHAEVIYPLDKQGRKLMYPPETHISDTGKKQFTSLMETLRNRGVVFDLVETSPYTRAVESAQVLAEVFRLGESAINPGLSDSYVPGWIGVPLSKQQELMDKGEDIYLHPLSEDQEVYEQVAKRMTEAFQNIVKENEGKTVALVSHGDPIRLLMHRLDHPIGIIPNMSILSKEGYLKRGEVFQVTVDKEGKIFEKKLISNLEGIVGIREIYEDGFLSPESK